MGVLQSCMHWALKTKKPNNAPGPSYTKVHTQENQMSDLGEEPASDWEDFDDSWDQNPISVVVDKPSSGSGSSSGSSNSGGPKGDRKTGPPKQNSKPKGTNTLSPIQEGQTPTSPHSPVQSTSVAPSPIAPPPETPNASSLPPASSLLSMAVGGLPVSSSDTSRPSPQKPLSFTPSSPTQVTAKAKVKPEEPEVQEREEDFFSDLGMQAEYKEQKRVKVPVSSQPSSSSQKKSAPATQSAPTPSAVSSRYSMDVLSMGDVSGEAWDGGDIPIEIPDSELSEGPSDSRKKKKTGSKGKKKKGLLASPQESDDGKKKSKLVASVDDDVSADIDSI